MTVEEEESWESVYGTTGINGANHIITYGGGPEGGYVMMNSAWYEWNREWFNLATYRWLVGKKLIWRHLDDEDEKCKVVPYEYRLRKNEHNWDRQRWNNKISQENEQENSNIET